MKKLIPLLILFSACSKDDVIVPQKNYTFSIDSVLTQNGTKSLSIDANGYYHLKLISNSNQQPYRVTGRILVNDKEPIPAENIEWESNLYWWIRRGDTAAYISKSYINYFTGQFTIISLPPMIVSKDELVPTINKTSYSGKNGEINTVIAPISEMKGDTMVIKAFNYNAKKTIYTKVILD
jgi:hypothetical protein